MLDPTRHPSTAHAGRGQAPSIGDQIRAVWRERTDRGQEQPLTFGLSKRALPRRPADRDSRSRRLNTRRRQDQPAADDEVRHDMMRHRPGRGDTYVSTLKRRSNVQEPVTWDPGNRL